MRAFRPPWMASYAILIVVALIPQLPAQDGDITTHNDHHDAEFHTETPILKKVVQDFLQRLKATRSLSDSQLQPRSPVETPPTEYLPYAPPPNYVWPPGPHTQYPPPSETNAPKGWYGGTGTGGQGNSGAGSAVTSSAAPRLRVPSLLSIPLHTLALLIPLVPASLLPPHRDRSARRRLEPRDPVETPPTQFLPYPPPPAYQWPPGQNPGNEYPQPSEPNPGYGNPPAPAPGYPNPNPNTAPSTQNYPTTSTGAPKTYGPGHLAWILIVTILATGVVVGGTGWWCGRRKAAAAGAGGGDEEKGGLRKRIEGMRFWGGKKKVPPAAAAAAEGGEGEGG